MLSWSVVLACIAAKAGTGRGGSGWRGAGAVADCRLDIGCLGTASRLVKRLHTSVTNYAAQARQAVQLCRATVMQCRRVERQNRTLQSKLDKADSFQSSLNAITTVGGGSAANLRHQITTHSSRIYTAPPNMQ